MLEDKDTGPTLTITGVTGGALNTGSDGYIKNNSTSNSFSPSTTSLSGGQKVLTVTVAGSCSPATGTNSCANNIKAGGPGILLFVPVPLPRPYRDIGDRDGDGFLPPLLRRFCLPCFRPERPPKKGRCAW